MNISDTDDPNGALDDAGAEQDPPRRSTSRDLDAIAMRLAGARSKADAQPTDDRASASSDGQSTGDGARARDAARIRSLMDRSPDDAFVPAARGYASALPDVSAATSATSTATPAGSTTVDRMGMATGAGVPADTESASGAPEPLRFPRQDELVDRARPMPAVPPRRLARAIAVGVTATAGLVIALGAYAGGGELVSSIIDGDDRPVAATPASGAGLAPVIIDSALSSADSIADAEQRATFGELPNDTIRRAPFGSGRIVSLPGARRPRVGDSLQPQGHADGATATGTETPNTAASVTNTTATPPKPTPPAPKATSATTTSAMKTTPTPSATASKASPSSTKPAASSRETAPATRDGQAASRTAAYLVQIRATPDRGEADRLASRLRSRGASNVTVTPATKDGATVYRVRYGSFPSADAARTAARRDGHAGAWIVKR